MVDTNMKKCFIRVIPYRKKWTLLPLILEHATPGCKIHTDEHRSYFSLKKYGFKHTSVKHKLYYKAFDGTHTNLIESIWSQLKTVNKQRRGTAMDKFPLHVDEWLWRWNKSLGGDVFDMFLGDIAKYYPI